MVKTYRACTAVSFTAYLKDGASKRIQFESQSLGDSIYITRDKSVQDAIERHPLFGKLFALHSVMQEEDSVMQEEDSVMQEEDSEEASGSMSDTQDEGSSDDGVHTTEATIEVACLDDAKQWLIDNLGAPKSKLRNRNEILRYAEHAGINFVGTLE